MSARTFTTILSLAAVPFFACGGDSKTVDSGLVLHDTGNGSGSGSGSGSNNVCAVMSSYNITFDMNNSAEINGGSDVTGFPHHNVFVGGLGSAQTDPQVQVDIVGGAGATNSPDWPTNLGPKTGLDLSTALKDVQVAIYVNGQQLPAYLATAGTLNVTAASNNTGSNFAGNITGLTLTHVDISGNMATPDPDGCKTTFANLTWSGALAAPQFDGKSPVTVHPVLIHRYQ
jgi:hypothetical protein